ncbi:MAG: outer membrane protein transport protein [Desulfobacterota bacterium]|nr:outer membrane protein transport protein [Thermodesulfobacteriota bacterium]
MRKVQGLLLCLTLSVCCVSVATTSFGGGFALYEGSARGNALGGSVIAKANDPAAIFFNPAGITQLPGKQIAMGATIIIPSTHMTTEQWGRSEDSKLKWNYFVPPYAYLTYQHSDRLWLGVGVFARFGLGTEFDEDWPGRFNSYNAFVRVVELNPNVAWKVDEKLSVSVGASVARLDLKLESKAPLFDYDTSLTGNGMGFGYNFGLHYKLVDWVMLGLSYRSKMHLDVSGRADFIRPDWAGRLFRDGKATSTVTLPDELMMGVNFQLRDNLSIELSTILTRWSSFDQMSILFDNDVAGMGRVTKRKDWRDVWRYQIGIEYGVSSWCDLRAGYVYDNGPIPRHTVDYLVPSNDRQLFCVGTGFKWRAWTIDFSYIYLIGENRNYNARPEDGVLKGRAHEGDTHLIGFGIGYAF